AVLAQLRHVGVGVAGICVAGFGRVAIRVKTQGWRQSVLAVEPRDFVLCPQGPLSPLSIGDVRLVDVQELARSWAKRASRGQGGRTIVISASILLYAIPIPLTPRRPMMLHGARGQEAVPFRQQPIPSLFDGIITPVRPIRIGILID